MGKIRYPPTWIVNTKHDELSMRSLERGPNFLANDDVGKSSDSGQSRWNHIVGYTSNGLYPLVICYIVIVNGD
jgi:hypothetical protein